MAPNEDGLATIGKHKGRAAEEEGVDKEYIKRFVEIEDSDSAGEEDGEKELEMGVGVEMCGDDARWEVWSDPRCDTFSPLPPLLLSSRNFMAYFGCREVKRRKEARRRLPRPDLITNLAKEFNRLKLEAADAKAQGDNERRKNASSLIGQLRREMESCGLTSAVDDLVDQWQAAEQQAKQGDEETKQAQQSDSEFEAGSKDQLLSFFDVLSLALREMDFLSRRCI